MPTKFSGIARKQFVPWPRTGIAAVSVNAVSGMVLCVSAIFLDSIFTLALAALLVILFGPLLGFISSSSSKHVRRTPLLASKIDEHQVESTLEALREDAEFWRFIARSSNTLISKLVALSILRIHLRFTAELGASRELNDKQLAMIGDILRPSDRSEIGFAETIEENSVMDSRACGRSGWLQNHGSSSLLCFDKPNATGNRFDAKFAGLYPSG